MSIVPIRDLAKYGILTDPDAYDLPTQAFTFGANVRFRNGKISRGPVFRNVANLSADEPRFCAASNPTSGLDLLALGYKSGRVYKYSSGVQSNISVSGYTDADSEGQWSSTHLADVFYVNREDRPPWYMRTSDAAFITLGNWDASHHARLIRALGSALIAFNVTKGATNYPTMVKTSSFAQAGTIPSSWDFSDPATNASENILAEMEGPIIDAQTLSNRMFIYGLNETWLMQFVGGVDTWDYEKVFQGRGAINTNCSIEVEGKHYVFGVNDIWTHDGNSDITIADQRVRDFIFNSINISKANRCFVAHNPKLNEIHFNFVSGDGKIAFDGNGCNRAAIYNYRNNTWTFDDVPLVLAATNSNLDNTLTYSTVTGSYDTIGGTYLDQEDSFKKVLVFVGEANATYGLGKRLYAFDQFGEGSVVAFNVDTVATRPMYLERDGIDLDDLGVDLRGYKTVTSVYPQARLGADASPITFTFGSSDYYNQAAQFGVGMTYDGNTLYKLDYNQAGRYLSMRIDFPDYKECSISGFDLDLQVNGER